MKSYILLTLMALALTGVTVNLMMSSPTVVQADNQFTPEELKMWAHFKKTYNKRFSAEDPSVENLRMDIFFENVESIQGIDALGITQYMDLTPQEFMEMYLDPVEAEQPETIVADLPAPANLRENVNIDWVAKGAVTTPKNQGQCGGCWAFATTGGVEGANFISTGDLTSLSEQQLINCVVDNDGCGGGLRDVALNYVIENGLTTEEAYPYKAVDGTCDVPTPQPYTVTRYTRITTCPNLVEGILQGPVTIGIDASTLQFYTKGILKTCGKSINHGVLLVGYNSEEAYWKVKNSWGTTFGEGGYFKLSADVTKGSIANTCALCTRAYQPFLDVPQITEA